MTSHLTRLMVFGMLGMPIASLAQTAAPEVDAPNDRISAFFFQDEITTVASTPQIITLHAAAIQTGIEGSERIWINGMALGVGDSIGPVRIQSIDGRQAMLEIGASNGSTADPNQVQRVTLALNQTLTLEPAGQRSMPMQIVGIHEGTAAMLRRSLTRTRLP